jgi:hypothetical protein
MGLLNLKPETLSPAGARVERVTTAQTDSLFNFQPGTVDELVDDLREPKQPFDVPNFNSMDPAPESPPTETEMKREATVAATQVIDFVDGSASFALSFVGKRDAKHYRLDAGSKQMIKPHLAEYLKGKSVDIPPGFMLLFVVVMVYMPIIQRAMDDRKEWKAQQAKPADNPAPETGTETPAGTVI